jgi:hypothetical protein
MNRYMLSRVFFLFVLSCLFFPACSDSSDGGDDGQSGSSLKLTVYGNSPRYYSLSTGKEVTSAEAIASTAWDLAFPNGREIRTNSGDSAANAEGGANSGGNGGVWYTNKTDFDDVSIADMQVVVDGFDSSFLHPDTRRWVEAMDATGTLRVHQKNFNVLFFVGYDNENVTDVGTSQENCYSSTYLYDKKAFYKSTPGTMPPKFEATNQVYIVRHGDGTHHSKIQITVYERQAPKETYTIRYEHLD